jgi:RNA polymerase sigma-54 factor
MELRQRLEMRRLMVPELRQSLKILSLPLLDLKNMVEQELINNPFLEELPGETPPPSLLKTAVLAKDRAKTTQASEQDWDKFSLISRKPTLQDVLLRQLGMFANTDEELKIGQEIIGNIDENGYLKATLEEIGLALGMETAGVESALKLIQQFDPPGVAARSIPECLLIQLELANECEPLIKKIVEEHLDDVAKKNFTRIAKCLKEPPEKIEACLKKILRLDPKPGRNYASEEVSHIVPDIIIGEKDEALEIAINNEDIPTAAINKEYRAMLKRPDLTPEAKEYLKEKLSTAVELLRAISKRHSTLRKVIEAIVEIQHDAIRQDLSLLKPLTFQEVAGKIGMHESTVCRVVMNKYVQTPHGMVALKDFFSGRIKSADGTEVSSNFVKCRIKELIDAEDKKHPLSDEDIAGILLKENGLKVARRTLAKYREDLKILSSAFRREH